MKKYKNLLFYIATIGGSVVLLYLILLFGKKLETGRAIQYRPATEVSGAGQLADALGHNFTHPLAILLLQIITIIFVARLFGFVFKKIGQPSVIGEIIAGILMGPSFLGLFFPEASVFLFPPDSLANLQFLSQIGLILFMFVIGMELDLNLLKNQIREAIVISHASIVFPFVLGTALAFFLYENFAPQGVRFLSFALFLGIAMSITAFPVLARIVQERGLFKTSLGAIVITCAATDDVTAWCLLAAVIAIVKAGSFYNALYTLILALIYVLAALKLVQPFLKKLGDIYSYKEGLGKSVTAVFFITLLISAYTTEVIGIHALFGAFMAGVIMPPNATFRSIFIEKVEDVALVLLLPLFFVFTGLRTQIGLLGNDSHLWLICAAIIGVAIAGKFLGSSLAALFVGQSWRNSLIIGALMNTRGLMELVVLNIGYDLGILSPEIFAMMVLMALLTTFMTGPALDAINRFLPERKAEPPATPALLQDYKVLIAFASPERGRSMLKVAHGLVQKLPVKARITALHLTPSSQVHQYNMEEYEKESFQPIYAESEMLKMPVHTLFKPSQDIDRDIIETANSGEYDLLLMGIGNSVFEGTLLGKILGFTIKIINPERLYDTVTGKEKLFEHTGFDDRTRQILDAVEIPVGILIDKELQRVNRVFVPVFSEKDLSLLAFVQNFSQNGQAVVTLADARENALPIAGLPVGERIRFTPKGQEIRPAWFENQDLFIIGIESWKEAIQTEAEWLVSVPSVLVVRS